MVRPEADKLLCTQRGMSAVGAECCVNAVTVHGPDSFVCGAVELNDERELSTLSRLACGGVAGTTGQTVAYPLDVVRRRMQVLAHAKAAHVSWGMWDGPW